MITRQSLLIKTLEETCPSCAADCMWYEPNEDHTCTNRRNFICHVHRAEIFGDKKEVLSTV